MPQQSARDIALAGLQEWRKSHRFADAILQDLLAANPLPASDRAFAIELSYGVLRNLILLDFWIDLLRDGKLDCVARDLLRLGFYQLLLLRTPEHAAVYETVHLARPKQRALINGILRAAQRQREELQAKIMTQPLNVRTSHPHFLIDRWEKNFGEREVVSLCEWNNRPAPVYARLNQLKVSTEEFLHVYPTAGALPNHPDFVELSGFPTAALDRGLCYVQDPSTIRACELLDPQPGESVLDACAAPGGKTGVIAQQMENRGSIVACDREPHRLERLTENLRRLEIENATVMRRDWTSDHNTPSLAQFDRILLDAPCSNTGVMRRRVDVRWRLRPADFARRQKQQLAIARAVLVFLKPGGVFVYSTCSLEPEENQQVASRVCEEFPQLQFIEQSSVTPFRNGFDGAFAAKFIRRG